MKVKAKTEAIGKHGLDGFIQRDRDITVMSLDFECYMCDW